MSNVISKSRQPLIWIKMRLADSYTELEQVYVIIITGTLSWSSEQVAKR